MSIEELEKMESDPEELFKQFCVERLNVVPDEHKTVLFKKAYEEYEKGAEEQ